MSKKNYFLTLEKKSSSFRVLCRTTFFRVRMSFAPPKVCPLLELWAVELVGRCLVIGELYYNLSVMGRKHFLACA